MKPFLITSILRMVLSCAFLAGCSASGIYHQAQSGETLEQIARVYGCSESQLARVNGFDSPQSLRKGQRLFIPGAVSLRRTTAKEPHDTTIKRPLSTSKTTSSTKKFPSIKSSNIVKKAPLPENMAGRFVWPLKGAILRRFGDKNPFPCKGIEIAAIPGSPVKAAAAGRVIYSGNGIDSFGNMIILRHDGDFYTVYAFSQRNTAKVGTFVSKGEQIALSGVPPHGRSSRLYFELRYHKEPVDPTFYLP